MDARTKARDMDARDITRDWNWAQKQVAALLLRLAQLIKRGVKL